jgi:hypothetical protein
MPHQKLLLIMIRVGLITTITTLWRNFPLKEVAQPMCRWTQRDSLDKDCKVDIIAWSHNKDIWTLLFSALWWTSYKTPAEEKSGWHPSLDLPSSEGTPVYAIHDGEVINASDRTGYGLSITIKHSLNNQYIFSNYSHLNEMLVKKWDIVKGNTIIGKVGCTWFSISGDPTRCGNHLDFQLTTDKSPSHPYGYGDCTQWTYFDAVEKWLCADKLRAYTIDPLAFFANHTDLKINYPLIAAHIASPSQEHTSAPEKEKTPKQSLQSIFARLREQNNAILWLSPKETSTPTKTITSSLAATVAPAKTTQPEAPFFETNMASVDIGTIHRSWNGELSNLTPYKVLTLNITIQDKLGNSFIWTLPQAFKATIDNAEVWSFFPNQFTLIHTDKKHLFFQTRQPGKATLSFRYGDSKIGEEVVTIKEPEEK